MANVVVAQSGGPTAVINASLLGVVDGWRRDHPGMIDRMYAAHHGIEGILREELIDLDVEDEREVALLRTTPASGAIGTCRYKIAPEQEEDLDRLVGVFRAHGVGFFFYIGGNDSMDTAHRVSEFARGRGIDLVCVGVPKTIDNDLGDQDRAVIDHNPGYGSVARYWANLVVALNEENRGSCRSDPVLVVQAMGRRIGFIPAAARLADPEREMPLQIYLAESGVSLQQLAENVRREVARTGRAIVVVCEGLDAGFGGERCDAFGHAEYGASEQSVAQIVVNHLNEAGVGARGSARCQIPGTAQRHAMLSASTVDLNEAHQVGRYAVEIAVSDGSGYMATIVREPGALYRVSYGKAPLAEMADSVRTFPIEWIAPGGCDVTDEYVEYARPLIGEANLEVPFENGLPRFARLRREYVAKRCSAYVPEAYRKDDR